MSGIDEPFGRQPKPVTVTLEGEDVDVKYWIQLLMRYASNSGDNIERPNQYSFRIYPRAVND